MTRRIHVNDQLALMFKVTNILSLYENNENNDPNEKTKIMKMKIMILIRT